VFDSQEVLAFVNTRLDRPGGTADELAERDGAGRWLARYLDAFAERSPDDAEYARLVAVRDAALRLVRARSAGLPPAVQDLETVNRASAAAPRAEYLGADWQQSVRFASSESPRPHDPTELLSALAGGVVTLVAGPSDIGECGADDCVVLFLRTDPRRRWHSYRCGNRMRAARSYARHRTESVG
jgi:predicted RNA-binding Zn ribbon-like protein